MVLNTSSDSENVSPSLKMPTVGLTLGVNKGILYIVYSYFVMNVTCDMLDSYIQQGKQVLRIPLYP